jgi:hypothetical protein
MKPTTNNMIDYAFSELGYSLAWRFHTLLIIGLSAPFRLSPFTFYHY